MENLARYILQEQADDISKSDMMVVLALLSLSSPHGTTARSIREFVKPTVASGALEQCRMCSKLRITRDEGVCPLCAYCERCICQETGPEVTHEDVIQHCLNPLGRFCSAECARTARASF